MWTRTPLTALLEIELPIVQGPLGGGNSTPELAAAVSNAGALGGFGAVGLAPEEITAAVREIACRTRKPFNVNLWVPIRGQDDFVPSIDETERSLRHIRPLLRDLRLDDPLPPTSRRPRFEEQVEALLSARPPVWSFVMGVPDRQWLKDARKRGIKTVGTATTVDEAVALADAGVDAIVASGSDAGGHRGSFLRAPEQSLVGTMSLVPQIADAVGVPVIAAGGIADGRGIAAALSLGADGVQLGTAFLVTSESGAPAANKAALADRGARITRLTRTITGRLARALDNTLTRTLDLHAEDALPYPAQQALTRALCKAVAAAGRIDSLVVWAGQNAASCRPLPAAALVEKLAQETDELLSASLLRPRENQ